MNRSALSQIESRVKKHVETCFPATGKPRFVTGVSGGPDSMALLYIFWKLGIEALVVHVNYRKRGEESDRDEELVCEMAHQWGFDCHCVRLDPPDEKGINFQQWARRKRYRIFRELAGDFGADGIAVAHNRDDQIETVLQKLFRGGGLESWSGMQVWDEPLFRPLLDTDRSEIVDFIEREAIPHRVDKSNLESDFARNLLRNEWLDRLEQFFPGWRQNILRLSEQAAIFGEALDIICENMLDVQDRIDLADFSQMHPALQKATVLHLLKKIDPSVEISTGALDQIVELPNLQPGKSIQLNDTYSLSVGRERFKIVFEPPESRELVVLERDDLRENAFFLDGLSFQIEAYGRPDYERALYLDADRIDWPIRLRYWKAGDRFQPFGMVGHQNVSDHLTNRKISPAEKGEAMVIESFEEMICAVIFPPIEKLTPPGTISEQVRCDEQTDRCLVIDWKQNQKS